MSEGGPFSREAFQGPIGSVRPIKENHHANPIPTS